MAVDGNITLFTDVKIGNVDTSAIKQSLASMTPKEIEEAFRSVNKTVMSMYSQLAETARVAAKNSSDALVMQLKSQQGVVSRYADQIKYAFLEMQTRSARSKPLGDTVDNLRDKLAEYPALIKRLQSTLDELKQSANMKSIIPDGDVSSVEGLITNYQRLNNVATTAYNSINTAFIQAKKTMDTEAQDMLKEPRNQISEYVDTLRYAFLNWNMAGSPAEGQLHDNLIAIMNEAKNVSSLTSFYGGNTAQLATATTETANLVSETEQLATAYHEVSDGAKQATSSIKGAETKVSTLNKTTGEVAHTLNELGSTASNAGEQSKQGAEKATNAHKNFQTTLGSVKYALSAIGISSSSILGKMVTLVGLVEDAFRGAGSAAQSIIPIFGVLLSIGVSVFGTIIKWARKLINVLTQIGQKIVSIASKGVSVAKKAVTSIADKIKGFIDFFKPSLAKLKKWLMQWGLGARSPYFVIRKIRTMVIEGMKEIAQYSDSVATSMNNFKTALNQVKGSVVSAFEPVASYVIPVLTRLLNMLASVLDSIARFNATLLGRSSYFKFVASDVTEYGNAVSEAGKASKKVQRDLMGFDEINRLSAPNDGASGGTGSASTGKYVETAIDTETGISKWAKRIREAWIEGFYDENGDYVFVKTFEDSMRDLYDVFWDIGFKIGVNINSGLLKFNSNVDNYKQTAMKIAQCLAAAINGIVDTPMLGYNIGSAIANVFNIVFSGLHQFATTVHWADIGKFIGDGIAGALETFDWYQFFDTIVTFVNGFFTLLGNIVKGHNWFDIGFTVGDALVDAIFKFDAASAGKAVHDFFDAIAQAIGGFAAKMSERNPVLLEVTGYSPNGRQEKWAMNGWEALGYKINKFFKEALTSDLGESVGSAFGQIASGIMTSLTTADFGDAAASFWGGFTKALGESDIEKALSEFWTKYEPKILTAIDTAIPTLCKAIKRLWDGIKEPVLAIITEIATVVWQAIQELAKSGAEKLGKGLVDSAAGYDYEDKLMDEQTQRTLVYEHQNDEYFDKLTDEQLEKIEKWRKENPESKRTEGQKEAMKEYERWKKEQNTQKRKDRDTLYDTYYEDPLRYAEPQPEVNFDNSELENSSAKIRQEVGKTSKAYEESSQTISTANSQIQGSSKFTASTVQDTSSKIKQSNQTAQQSFATTASGMTTATSIITASTSTMGSVVTAGLQGIQNASDATFASIEPAAQGAYDDMTTTFDGATGYFEDLWSTVTDTFSVDGDIAKGLAVGMGIIMNTSVNKMIDAINTYAIDPLMKLASAVDMIRSFSFAGLQPFAGLPKLNFFKIPKLAQGAVLPPNQPFLSIVGDQSRGTNVEAPLETIKQAVAEVMSENQDVILAVGEAIVQAINNKDTTAVISYRAIGEANKKYNREMETIRGY